MKRLDLNENPIYLLKNLHLLISLAIVAPFSFVYGFSPADTLPIYFDFTVETTDLSNVFRAIMGLYLAISALWLLGMLKPTLWKTATLVNILFMLGLAFGRLLSLVLDGTPSQTFVTALFLELALGSYAAIQFRNYKE